MKIIELIAKLFKNKNRRTLFSEALSEGIYDFLKETGHSFTDKKKNGKT